MKQVKKYWPFYLMALPAIVYLIINNYIPMFGLVLAFKKINFSVGIWKSAWTGLSMGSKQTCQVGLGHPGIFSYLGIFSGAIFGMNDLNPDPIYLEKVRDRSVFVENYRLLFRSIGDQDPFMGEFEIDDAALAQMRLSPEEWPAHIRRVYPGKHLWNTWRLTMYDFLPKLFRESIS